MAGILIIAHAPLAQALLNCAQHVYNKEPERVVAVDVVPNAEPAEVIAQVGLLLPSLVKHNGAIILTDVCGATPANIALQIAHKADLPLLAGVNLPMLLRAMAYRTRPVEVLVQAALTGASQGVMRLA